MTINYLSMKKIRLALILLCLTNVVLAKPIDTSIVVVDTVLVDENVSYILTQDDRNLYLNVSTSDEKTIMSMLHLGVSVFFDIKGKKKENVYIKYPLETKPPIRKRNNETRENIGFEEEDENRKLMILNILEKDYSQKAEYGYFDESREFNILLNTLEVSVAFTYDENEGLFEYNLQIPKSLIDTDSKLNLEKLTIGVKTNTVERKKNENAGLNANLGGISVGQQGGSRGGGQGGPPGGGKGIGGQKGVQKGPPKEHNQDKPSGIELNYWFDAKL